MNSTFFLLLAVLLIGSVHSNEDPELKMDAYQIIRRWGYPAEEHVVETEDGYLLRIQRIPRGIKDNSNSTKKRPVVFMQHGLEACSTNWISNLPNESAGYIFADAGFDVWLGNFRGNTYGRGHINPKISADEFWKFSWDEMALKDLPAAINFALKTSGQDSLYFIGHSEGTMTPFALLSAMPEFSTKIKRFFALGPVATVGHVEQGLIHLLAHLRTPIEDLFKLLGIHDFVPDTWLNKLAAKTICTNPTTDKLICDNLLFQLGGANTHQLNSSRVPVYVSHNPAGTSVQNIVHFAQGVAKNTFARYDYGNPITNFEKYGSFEPPKYDLTQVRSPVYLFWGSQDILADKGDIEETLIPNLRTLGGNFELDFNHLDFIWGMHARKMVYEPIIKIVITEDNLTQIRIP